ncbi:MAG: hypothetical protein SNJ56_05080, partial [Termitinemataceae bacterium]
MWINLFTAPTVTAEEQPLALDYGLVFDEKSQIYQKGQIKLYIPGLGCSFRGLGALSTTFDQVMQNPW